MTDEGVWPKTSGSVLYASEVNFMARPVKEVYVGTGFDIAHTGTGTTSASYEFTAITVVTLLGSKYIKINILYSITQDANSSTRWNTIKLEKKHVGGAYEEILPETTVANAQNDGTSEGTILLNLPIIYELDADDLTNGIQLKISTTGNGNDAASVANLTNIQTVVELS